MNCTQLAALVDEHYWSHDKEYPLYHCRASVKEIAPHKCYILRSYNSLVAVADCTTAYAKIYVFNYYSPTTNSTHISRFRKWLNEHLPFAHYEIVPLYRTSHMSKRAYEAYSRDNWSSVIDDSIGQYFGVKQ